MFLKMVGVALKLTEVLCWKYSAGFPCSMPVCVGGISTKLISQHPSKVLGTLTFEPPLPFHLGVPLCSSSLDSSLFGVM